MKKIVLLIAVIIVSAIGLTATAQSNRRSAAKVAPAKEKAAPVRENKGEKTFLQHADKALSMIEQEALKIGIKGTAVVAYIPGEKTQSWTSKMKVIGFFTNDNGNTLGVAYTKAAEMADTFKDSGSGSRKVLTGEYGWPGGVIRKVNSGYVLASFSGASGEQDVQVATEGLNWLVKQYAETK